MCTDPQTQDGKTFACRRCDQCIATRRHGWVARAMAEKATNSHAVCLTLTYSDETQQGRDGAAMFGYADVRDFMARLRSAARREAKKHKWNVAPSVRFIAAGEQGDRNGRCHWHLIIYTNFDLSRLGQFRRSGKLVSHYRDMITQGKRKRRLNWTLWPHGFMTLQEPDQAGMNYILSYCLKDQFTVEKSYGTMREAKAENFATGLFRMSKRPAIGESWLMRKMESLEAQGAVLPSLQIKIPDMSGYWHPNGSFREKVLWALVALNQRIYWRTGAYAPQWAALLASCQDNPSDMEILNAFQRQTDPDAQSIETALDFRQREAAGDYATAETRRKCGGQLPCSQCLASLSREDLDTLGIARDFDEFGEIAFQALDGFQAVADRQRAPGAGINPFCQNRGGKNQQRAFPRTASASGSGHL